MTWLQSTKRPCRLIQRYFSNDKRLKPNLNLNIAQKKLIYKGIYYIMDIKRLRICLNERNRQRIREVVGDTLERVTENIISEWSGYNRRDNFQCYFIRNNQEVYGIVHDGTEDPYIAWGFGIFGFKTKNERFYVFLSAGAHMRSGNIPEPDDNSGWERCGTRVYPACGKFRVITELLKPSGEFDEESFIKWLKDGFPIAVKIYNVIAERNGKPKIKLHKKIGEAEKPKKNIVETTTFERNPKVVEYVKEQANGICQLCKRAAPFHDNNGKPYLECHHIFWLSEGGDDTFANAVALCPNCHKKMHILNIPSDVEELRKVAGKYEKTAT